MKGPYNKHQLKQGGILKDFAEQEIKRKKFKDETGTDSNNASKA